MVGLGHARWSMERLRAGADEGCERMEQDGTENGIEWDRMGQWLKEQWETRVCRSTKQQCTDVPSVQPVWHPTLACGHVGMEWIHVGYLCPTVGRVGNAMPMQTGQTPRRLQLQARPAYSSLTDCVPPWVGVLPGGGGR